MAWGSFCFVKNKNKVRLCMNYKLSKFNYAVPNGESLIFYNFYTKAYMQIPCDKCDVQTLTANCFSEALSQV